MTQSRVWVKRGCCVVAAALMFMGLQAAPAQAGACSPANTISGTSGPDSIRGGGGFDCILGLGGADSLNGAGSHDHLLGGDGNDSLFGARGADFVNGGNGADSCFNDGTDTLVNCE